MLAEFAGLSTPLVADACIRRNVPLRVAPPGIGAVIPGRQIAGRALPARDYGSVDVFLEAFSSAGGYAHRTADPGDRRRIVVTASTEGLAKVGRRYAPIGEAFARQFASYTDDELRTVLKFMRDGRNVSEAEIDRIRGAGTPHATRPR